MISTDERQWLAHVTVAAIAEQQGRFLFVEENVRGNTVINQPAGHLEPNETLIEAVMRETLEETAWHFKPQAIVGVYLYHSSKNDTTYQRICFSGECYDRDPDQTLDDGIEQALWLNPEELQQRRAQHRSQIVERCLADYLSGKRYPLELVTHL